MSQWLRQGTAAVVTFGPFLAKGNGVTVLSGAGIIASIDHATTGILLSKNGGAAAIRHQAVSPSTYDAHGFFKVALDATDTDTPGTLLMMHSEPATYLSVWRVFMVIPQQVWDSLFGTDMLQVDVQEQANIDFSALQKASLDAATPAVTVSDKTGFSLAVTPPTAAEIRGEMDDHSTQLAAIASAVAPDGSSTYTDTILDPDGDPIDGVSVECYSDSDYTTLAQVTETNANGVFIFHLDPATYYFRAVKVGYSFSDWAEVIE